MAEFSVIEESVNQKWESAQTTATAPLPPALFKELAAEWAKATAIAREVNRYELPGPMHAFTVHLTDYCAKRGVLFNLLEQGAGHDSQETRDAIDSLQTELDQITSDIDNLSK